MTEPHPPNVRVATKRLGPFGVSVIDTPSVAEGSLPIADGSFDLVLNRHGSIEPRELARILVPGGVFLTEQVNGLWAHDLKAEFGVVPEPPLATPERYVPLLEQAGFEVLSVQDWSGSLTFMDVGAIVYYLRAVRLVPNFTVEDRLDVLLKLHERSQRAGRLNFAAREYLIEARRE